MGTIAVVVWLLCVVFSLNRDTVAIHGSTENIILEMHAALANQFMLDPTLADILVKMRSDNPQLTDIDAVRRSPARAGPRSSRAIGHVILPELPTTIATDVTLSSSPLTD